MFKFVSSLSTGHADNKEPSTLADARVFFPLSTTSNSQSLRGTDGANLRIEVRARRDEDSIRTFVLATAENDV